MSHRSRLVRVTAEELEAELEAIYAEHPTLRYKHRVCCSGCAESDLADRLGWGHPIIAAWQRVEDARFLLGLDA